MRTVRMRIWATALTWHLLLKNLLKADKTEWCCSFLVLFGTFWHLLLQLLVLLFWGFLYSTNFTYFRKSVIFFFFLILAFEKLCFHLCILKSEFASDSLIIVGFILKAGFKVLQCSHSPTWNSHVPSKGWFLSAYRAAYRDTFTTHLSLQGILFFLPEMGT